MPTTPLALVSASTTPRRGVWLVSAVVLLSVACGAHLADPKDESITGARPWATAIDPGPADLPSQTELEELANDASFGIPPDVAEAYATPADQKVSAEIFELLAAQPVEFVYSSLATFGTTAAMIDGTAGGQQCRFILSKTPIQWQIVTTIPLSGPDK